MRLKHYLYYWMPVIVYMGLIFYFSSLKEPSLIIEKSLELKFIIPSAFKHFIEFIPLGFLFFRAFNNEKNLKIKRNALWLAVVFAGLYGISDEFHQSFVPGRVMDGIDIIADAAGGSVFSIVRYLKNGHGL